VSIINGHRRDGTTLTSNLIGSTIAMGVHAVILMTPSRGNDDGDRPQAYAGPASVLTGLPRMIRRHELPLIVCYANIPVAEMLEDPGSTLCYNHQYLMDKDD